jgi:hypothetical protein
MENKNSSPLVGIATAVNMFGWMNTKKSLKLPHKNILFSSDNCHKLLNRPRYLGAGYTRRGSIQ